MLGRFVCIATVFASALALAACAGDPPLGGSSEVAIVQGSELPAPQRADSVVDDRGYLIGPYDKLVVDVYGIEEFKKVEVQADAGGRVAFPLVGSIDAAGKSPEELSAAIADGLRRAYVRDPKVTVNVVDMQSQTVTIDGQVTQPGLYPVTAQMSLMRAVARARGVNEFAKLQDVVVFRTVGGQRMAALYNLQAIRRGAYPDPTIYANDVVVVGDSPSRRLFQQLLQGASVLTTPVVVLIQQLSGKK